MKKINTKRGGHAFPKNVDEPYREWIRALPCILAGHWTTKEFFGNRMNTWHTCMGRVQACHVKSRGSGGKDRSNLFPGCAAAHEEQGYHGIRAFEYRWRVNLKEIAHRLTEVYEAERFPCP